MSLVVTATDNQNGTLTLTVTGADSATTVTAYYVLAAGGVWAVGGTRSGNGTLTLTLPAGGYWLYVTGTVSSAPAQSVPVLGLVSAATTAVQEQCEAAIQAKIQTLTLGAGPTGYPPALPAGNVQRVQSLDPGVLEQLVGLPAVLVAPGDKERYVNVNNNKDYVEYPVVVVVVCRSVEREAAPPAQVKLWRQQIQRALRYQALPAAPTIGYVTPEPGPILNWSPPEGKANLAWSAVTFWCRSYEQRG